MDDRLTRLEERLAETLRTIDDLSDLAASQARQIDRLEARVAMLMQREAEREATGAEVIADKPPPHW